MAIEQLPSEDFLMPADRKYPFKGANGKVSCDMLRAIIARTQTSGEDDANGKAITLFKKYCSI